KEFAEYLKMDVKKLADKIRYLEKKHEINFGTNSEDTKIYTEQEQYEICKLLEIPTFHISVHNETENFLSELNREKIKNSFEQLSELISAIDNADFIKLDENFDEKLIKKLGRNFAYWYARKNGETKFNDYQWGFIKFSDVAEYYRELKENKEK
ncbi:MAG: hypothetical protein L0G51_09800, partial [Lactococcus lactis]|nr:hypothetical protein [Lactococcus lactis]